MSSELKKRLPNIRSLAMLKMEKNFIALEKGYPRTPYDNRFQPIAFLIRRIHEELKELDDAYSNCYDIQVMKEECADISNLVDYLFEKLSRHEGEVRE